MKNASSVENIKTYVAVNWEEHANKLRDYSGIDHIIITNTDRIGVCYPSYQLSSKLGIDFGNCHNKDIVILASDDFLPPKNFDDYLISKFENRSGVLMCRDGYQLPDSSNMMYPAITIPIMTYDSLLKLNRIIYHTDYNHMFSDCELYYNSRDLGILIDDRLTDTTIFEHHHYAANKRNPDQMDLNYNSKFKDDQKVFEYRKKLPIEERVKI
jgi:hypothetical protein